MPRRRSSARRRSDFTGRAATKSGPERIGLSIQREVLRAGEPGHALESTGLYRLLVDSVTDYAMFLLDPEGHVRSWNDGARLIKQYEANEIIGRNSNILHTPEDIQSGAVDRLFYMAHDKGLAEGGVGTTGLDLGRDDRDDLRGRLVHEVTVPRRCTSVRSSRFHRGAVCCHASWP